MLKTRILFLAANPLNTDNLQLTQEAREIQEAIQKAPYREQLKFHTRWAVRLGDLLDALNDLKPAIVHFCGHGSPQGEILLEDDVGRPRPLGGTALTEVLHTLEGCVRLVVLNACYTRGPAERITEAVGFAAGSPRAIPDEDAIGFARAFYGALASGQSVRGAFRQGRVAVAGELRAAASGLRRHMIADPAPAAEDLLVLAEREPGTAGALTFTGPSQSYRALTALAVLLAIPAVALAAFFTANDDLVRVLRGHVVTVEDGEDEHHWRACPGAEVTVVEAGRTARTRPACSRSRCRPRCSGAGM